MLLDHQILRKVIHILQHDKLVPYSKGKLVGSTMNAMPLGRYHIRRHPPEQTKSYQNYIEIRIGEDRVFWGHYSGGWEKKPKENLDVHYKPCPIENGKDWTDEFLSMDEMTA